MGFSQASGGLSMMPKQRAFSIYLEQLNINLVACETSGLQQELWTADHSFSMATALVI